MYTSGGFIDLQCNGAFGIDLNSEPERLWEVAAGLPRYGVTAFLPTLISGSASVVSRALSVWRAGPPHGWRGAEPLGWHLEGPALAAKRRGTHPEAALRSIDELDTADWHPNRGVRLVTLAPELPGAPALIAELVSRGVAVSAGHSNASVPELALALDAGLGGVTHLFNAQAPLTARQPGVIAVGLMDDRLRVGLIADGIHVDPLLVQLTWRVVGAARLILVSDATAALGVAPGPYRLGDVGLVLSGDGVVRNREGGLAGSSLSLDVAVRNVMAWTGAPLGEVLATVTTTPAALLGLAARPADHVVLDEGGVVVETTVGGQCLYSGSGSRTC